MSISLSTITNPIPYCHRLSSIKSVQKVVALRLRHIWSTNSEYSSKPIAYQGYLNHRCHDPKTVHDTFQKISKIIQKEARKKVSNQNNQEQFSSITK